MHGGWNAISVALVLLGAEGMLIFEILTLGRLLGALASLASAW
jgi:hypothetical protein